MFDIGFTELLLIGVVALIVLGPERLPKVARTLGALLGRLNRYANQVKQDIDREMKLDELRKVQQDMQKTAQQYEIMANQRVQEVESGVQASVDEVGKIAGDAEASLGEASKLDWPQLDPALSMTAPSVSADPVVSVTSPALEAPSEAAPSSKT